MNFRACCLRAGGRVSGVRPSFDVISDGLNSDSSFVRTASHAAAFVTGGRVFGSNVYLLLAAFLLLLSIVAFGVNFYIGIF